MKCFLFAALTVVLTVTWVRMVSTTQPTHTTIMTSSISKVNCHEDEVLRVQRDTNPNHGLTWACEPLDDIIFEGFEAGWNAAIECMYGGGVIKTWGCQESSASY